MSFDDFSEANFILVQNRKQMISLQLVCVCAYANRCGNFHTIICWVFEVYKYEQREKNDLFDLFCMPFSDSTTFAYIWITMCHHRVCRTIYLITCDFVNTSTICDIVFVKMCKLLCLLKHLNFNRTSLFNRFRRDLWTVDVFLQIFRDLKKNPHSYGSRWSER